MEEMGSLCPPASFYMFLQNTVSLARISRAVKMRAILFAVIVAHAESLQYNNNRHFLMIHGSGMSGAAFLSSPTERGARNFLNGVPLRADHSTGLVPANWQYAALDARTDDGTWFGDGFKGLDKAVATVEAVLASRPEVAGIVGHEQGGTVAAVVAARAALGEGPRPLAFAIICGASMPTAKPYTELLQRLRSAEGSIPTLHTLSNTGTLAATGEELAACFGSGAEILWHEQGNAMPDKSWWRRTDAFPDRATGLKRYVDQYEIGKLFVQLGYKDSDDAKEQMARVR